MNALATDLDINLDYDMDPDLDLDPGLGLGLGLDLDLEDEKEDIDMMEKSVTGLSCSCPDNCNEVVYTQEVSSGPFIDTNSNFFKQLTGRSRGFSQT